MSAFFSSLLFGQPLALWALLTLPVIWWLLRATPPRPREQEFPPIEILARLKNLEHTPDKMPWWLLVLRLALAAVLIFAVAHPFQRKGDALVSSSTGPLLLVVDDGWAAAKDWPKRQEAALGLLTEAQGRVVYLLGTADPVGPEAHSATDAATKLRAWQPAALPSNRMKALALAANLAPRPTQVIWLADGLDAGSGNPFADGLNALAPTASFTLPGTAPPLALGKPELKGGDVVVNVLRAAGAAADAKLQAQAGDGRILAEAPIAFGSASEKQVRLSLPVELRNEIQSLAIKNENHAAAKSLLDDTWRRKTVAILNGGAAATGQPLLSAEHYITSALGEGAEITAPQNSDDLQAALEQGLSMLVLADVGNLPKPDQNAIAAWLNKGGLLLRFAGPHLAASKDDLLPVQLREGDRNLGSALSWETPQAIKEFAAQSPLSGMVPDQHIAISRQVLAEPDAALSARTWASLADGTPLITSAKQGNGRIVLVHTTANAEWSNLPLTGTFAELMQRLLALAPAAGSPAAQGAATLAEGDFAPRLLMTGTGELIPPSAQVKPIAPRDMPNAVASHDTPAGLYFRGGSNAAINVQTMLRDLQPLPPSAQARPLAPAEMTAYAGPLFSLAALLFLLDCLAAIFVGGYLSRKPAVMASVVLLAATVLMLPQAQPAQAQEAAAADLQAALETHLAFVKTGDADADTASEEGLKGLGFYVEARSSARLGAPKPIDIENDELVFYPLIYWPVLPDAPTPGPKAMANISRYMKNGGTIFFDLRNIAASLGTSAEGEALRRILSGLDVPALEPVPENHALSKSFYLLKDFPGRFEGGALWVETQDDPQASGFDNVSGLIIGSNDYAAAWASDAEGNPLYAMVPGAPRQREMAMRVGINLVMYVLTGNYKSDQVHIPALLQRLGKP
jgi:hypothetical protein